MCKYCDGELLLAKKDFDLGRKLEISIDDGSELCIWIDHNDLYHEEYIPINYCPMCGRKLKGECQ